MLPPAVPAASVPGALPFPDPSVLEMIETFQEPALLCLLGGRIAAVNRAAARLADDRVIGATIDDLLDRYPAARSDGRPVVRSDLPYARALRGEIVAHGERIAISLPNGSTYTTLITSTPIVRDGMVVAALSVWRDFDAYARVLARGRAPAAPVGPASGP